MGFLLYLHCFGETESLGLPGATIRSLFPVAGASPEPDFGRIHYDPANGGHVGVTSLLSDDPRLTRLCVRRPCGDAPFWESLISILSMGCVVLLFPGGPSIIGQQSVAPELPAERTDALGTPVRVHSGESIVRIVRQS